jgi:hypothetical protein
MAQKEGSSLHFDGLRIQIHGSKACKIYDQPILGGGEAYAPYTPPLGSATDLRKKPTYKIPNYKTNRAKNSFIPWCAKILNQQ